MNSCTMPSLLALVLLAQQAETRQNEKDRHREFVRTVVNAWKSRQNSINTIQCSAEVESFYPKGYLSDARLNDFPPEKPVGFLGPESDKTFRAEPCSWAIDFQSQRVRKEHRMTKPFFRREEAELSPDQILFLSGPSGSRVFRPTERHPTKAEKLGISDPDVFLYEGKSSLGQLGFSDLPLFWVGGGVSGQFPGPTRLRYLDPSERFTYVSDAVSKGRRCAVLTVQEQKDSTSQREFWVGLDEPYPIYYCRARDGQKVYWQIGVEYRRADNSLLPLKWTYTQYNYPRGRLFHSESYVIKDMSINGPLAEELFDKPLKPGMIVYQVKKNKIMEVDSWGNLVARGSTGRALVMWIILATTALVGIVALIVRRWRVQFVVKR